MPGKLAGIFFRKAAAWIAQDRHAAVAGQTASLRSSPLASGLNDALAEISAGAAFRYGLNRQDPGLYRTLYGVGKIPEYRNRQDGRSCAPRLKSPRIAANLVKPQGDYLVNGVYLAMRHLPGFLRTVLAMGGVEVTICRRLADLDADTAFGRERAAFPGYDFSAGLYDSATGQIAIMQETKSRATQNYQATATGGYKIMLHECGHALEDLLGVNNRDGTAPVSLHDRAFTSAYDCDVRALNGASAIDGVSFEYCLDQAHGGPHETKAVARNELFAEMFFEYVRARRWNPLNQTMPETAAMNAAFPRSVRVLDDVLAALEQRLRCRPDLAMIRNGGPDRAAPGIPASRL